MNMLARRLSLIAVPLAVLGSRGHAEQVGHILAIRADAARIDGVADEGFWQDAPVTEPFCYLGTHTEADKQTRARVAYDDGNVYVAVEAEEPAMEALRSEVRARDADETWRDDCIELFLTPALSGTEYHHLIFNVDGAKYDAFMGGEGLPAAWNPEPDWQVVVVRHQDRWVAEVAIPFKALGVSTPLRGEMWGLKICRSLWGRGGDRREDRFTSWSRSPSGSYHDPAGWGRLYFADANMLPNADFAAPPQEDGLPLHWRQQLNWNQGDPDTGYVRQEQREGHSVMRLHKTPEAEGSLLPRASTTVRINGGHRYRFSASVQTTGTLQLIFSFRTPRDSGYVPTPFELKGEDFKPLSAECDIPAEVEAVTLMMSFDRATTGEMWVERVSLTDLGLPARKLDVDPIHNLKTAAASLVEMKPYDRLQDEEGRYHFERLIFTDTGTGAEIRRITWDRHTANIIYSNRYPWNPDGSALKVECWERPGPLYFMVEPSGASFRPLGIEMPSQGPRWGRDPDLLVYGTRDTLMQVDWRTREQTEVFKIPEEIMHGARPRFTWNLEVPGIVYFEQAFGPDAPLYFIDLNTGQYTRIPITSDSTGDREKDWLYSAGLGKLGGQWWVRYSLNHLPHLSKENPYQQRLSSLDGKVGLNRLALSQPEGKPPQPLYSHGGRSPDGRYECGYHGGGIALWDFDTWQGKMLVPGPGGGHISWEYLDDWFFAGTSGAPLSGPFASQLLKVYVDGTWYTVAYGNTANTEYSTCLFANISPDGTKGAYMSSMLGPVNLYWCIISYPDPPTQVAATTAAAQVQLSWKRPQRSAEIAGYSVYRSAQSGTGYQRVNLEAITEESFTDTIPDPDRAYYYVVTSVEHSGLESRRYWAEVVAGKPDAAARERVFLEAEQGELKVPMRENFHGSASDLRFVDYRDGEGEGCATYTFPTRKAGDHVLWARIRYQGAGTPAEGWAVNSEGASLGKLMTGSREWEWVRLDRAVSARPGGSTVTVTAAGPGYAIDKLLLTDDADFEPTGKEGLDSQPPASPTNLRLTEARHFDIAFSWDAAEDDCDHYQVYRGASADFEPGAETLVGSPAVPRFVDWGLAQGTQHWYRVSAVDGFGNESAPSPSLAVQAPPLEQIVDVALEAEAGQTSQPMVIEEAEAASGGKYVKMAPRGEGEEKTFPTLDIGFEVPLAGEYIVWLKLCPVSDRGYAYLSAQVDGGPRSTLLCRFPTEKAGREYRDTYVWRYVYNMRDTLPTRLQLEPGEHRLTLSQAHMQDFGIDQIIVTNDLGKRPPGRHLEWEEG